MTLQGERFEPKELETVVSLLAGPGMIQTLDFGGFILLRPDVLSRYAAAAIRKVRGHPQELGCIREDDFVARYSADEFVVLMPQTMLAGALAFAERLLMQANVHLACPMWGGVVEAVSDETAEKLLSRADSALYSARAAGGASLFVHTGAGVRRHLVDLQPAAIGSYPQDELATFAG